MKKMKILTFEPKSNKFCTLSIQSTYINRKIINLLPRLVRFGVIRVRRREEGSGCVYRVGGVDNNQRWVRGRRIGLVGWKGIRG